MGRKGRALDPVAGEPRKAEPAVDPGLYLERPVSAALAVSRCGNSSKVLGGRES